MDNGDPSSGMIRLEVENVSTLTSVGKFSESIEVEGLPWKAKVSKLELNQKPYLGVYLFYVKSDSNLWSFNVHCNFELISNQKEKSLVKQRHKAFNHDATYSSVYMITWEDLMDATKGFVHEDKISVEIKFSVTNIMGIRKIPRVNFSDENDPRHQMAIEIEGEQIFVSREYLALHSPFFDRLFYGDFSEKRKKVVELKEVDPKEFKELLTVIYPSQAKVTDSNYRYLLTLGDRFEFKMILDKVEQHLISTVKLNTAEKLKLADQFRLVKLHDNCLESFKTVQQITDIKNTESYKSLSNDAKAALMDKIMRLSP